MIDDFDKKLEDDWEATEDDFQSWVIENKDLIEREKLRIRMIQIRNENKEFERINKIRVSLGLFKLRR